VPSACSVNLGGKSVSGKCSEAGSACVCMPRQREESPSN
jgi:hypothetical protein